MRDNTVSSAHYGCRSGPRDMNIKPRDVYTSRYFRHGSSYAVVLPPDIRALMGLVLGDTLAMNYQHGVLWMVKLTGSMVINRDAVAKVFDELFKDKAEASAR